MGNQTSSATGIAGLLLAPFTGGASTALSIGSIALGAGGSILSGMGSSSADKYKAEQLQQQAEYGELKATQTNAQLTQRMNVTLSNMDAVMGTRHVSAQSPTDAAVRNTAEGMASEQKGIQVDSLLAQSQQDEEDAAYMRNASSSALLSGGIGAGASLFKGFAGLPGLQGGGGVLAGGTPLGYGGIGMA
jgi:hypothetical protein